MSTGVSTATTSGWLDIYGAAKHTGRHPQTLRRAARAGELRGGQTGRRWNFRTDDLDRWMAGEIPDATPDRQRAPRVTRRP